MTLASKQLAFRGFSIFFLQRSLRSSGFRRSMWLVLTCIQAAFAQTDLVKASFVLMLDILLQTLAFLRLWKAITNRVPLVGDSISLD